MYNFLKNYGPLGVGFIVGFVLKDAGIALSDWHFWVIILASGLLIPLAKME